MSETFLPELPQELWRAGKLELAHGVQQSLQVIRIATAALSRFLAEIENRGVKDLYGHGSTASWFAEMAGLSRGEAGAVVKRALALLFIAAALPLLAGCGEAEDPVPERPSPTPEATASRAAGARSVIDMTGRPVQLDEEIRTVAAMSPAAAEFAAALGLEVVGRSSDTPETVAPGAKPTGSTISPDFNAIAALAPDLVLADAAYHAGRTRAATRTQDGAAAAWR